MAEQSALHIIARIHSDFPTKFGIPRQSGLVEELKATIVFEPEYRNPDALRGLGLSLNATFGFPRLSPIPLPGGGGVAFATCG